MSLGKIASIGIALLSCTSLVAPAALAQDYPNRPVTLIISGAAGAGGDIVGRTYAPYLEKCLGTSVAVVNIAGAGGAVARAELANTEPDGYTIGNVNLPNAVAESIEKGSPPPWEIFDYIGNVNQSRVGLHVRADSPFQTFQDLVDYAKANPRVVTVALSGLGNDDHITQLLMMQAAGIELTLVPLGASGLPLTSALGGHVSAFSVAAYETVPFKDQVRTLFLAAEERDPLLPDVPTLRELGYDIVGGSNQAVGMPKGAPPEVLQKLRDCYATTLADPDLLAEGEKRGLPLHYLSGEELEAFAKEQYEALSELWTTMPWKAQ